MKRLFLQMGLLGLVVFINLAATIVLAQDDSELEYSWGTVTSITSSQIVITEYDYDSDEEIDVAYVLTPNVKLSNVNSLKEISIGDEVWVDYVVKEGKKVAVNIEVSKYMDEEYPPSQAYDERVSSEEYTSGERVEREFGYFSEEVE